MTITLTREEAQQVLDALENFCEHGAILKPIETRDLLRARLSAPEPEQNPISDVTEAVTKTVISVEKLLCEKIGRQWEPSGMSITTLVDELASVKQLKPEPVAWQSRMRPDWEENGWTQWKDCPKEQADNLWKVPHLHDWVYEARALYAAPQKRELIGLTDEEIRNEANHHVFDESFFNGAIWARGQIMGKNNG